MNQRKLCMLDMDGVIADYVGATCRAHGLITPYGDVNCFGIFEMEKCWGMTEEKFWEPLATFDFWAKMPKTPEADEIVDLLIQKFSVENICILTNPSSYDGCIGAKKAWILENYPQFEKQMLFGASKHFLAGPGRFLVDDRTKNIQAFDGFGGIGITVPRPWNHRYAQRHNVVREIQSQLYLAEGR